MHIMCIDSIIDLCFNSVRVNVGTADRQLEPSTLFPFINSFFYICGEKVIAPNFAWAARAKSAGASSACKDNQGTVL